MRNKRDVEKLVSQLGLKHGSRQAVIQYGNGLLDGMRMACVAVARKMFRLGRTEAEVRELLSGIAEAAELRDILAEARGE